MPPPARGSKLPEYVRGSLNVKDKPIAQKLRFFFDYLDDADPEISNDAYKEFGNSDYKDFKAMAKDIPPDRVIKWLKNPETPSFRMGLYSSMLGHCGKEKDAAVLKALLDDPERKSGSGVDGIMAGYLLLTGETGLPLIEETKLRNKDAAFSETYAGMQALRFLWTYAPERIGPERLRAAMRILLERDDLADLVITDLARWEDWESLPTIAGLWGQSGYEAAEICRAIVGYLCVCPADEARAARERIRLEAPDLVAEVESRLALDVGGG